MTSPDLPLAPTAPRERLGGLDLLRGFALCGILIINIRYFAMPMARRALNNPNLPGDTFAAGDFWSWFGSNVLFEDKMMALFSMLFGAGIWLMRDRGLLLHYRRMFWLLLIGLFHAVVLWFGDILTLYALCGLVVVWFRRLPSSLLIVLGLSGVLVATGEGQATRIWQEATPLEVAAAPEEVSTPEAPAAEAEEAPAPAEQADQADQTWKAAEPETVEAEETVTDAETEANTETEPDPEAESGGLWAQRRHLIESQNEVFRELFAAETEAAMHQGSWWGQVKWRTRMVGWWQGGGFLNTGLLWNGGMMLIGMGLMGLGYLSGKKRAGVYLGLGFSSLVLGVALSVMGYWPKALQPLGRFTAMVPTEAGGSAEALQRLMMTAYQVRLLAVPLVAFGWASLLLWLYRARFFQVLLFPLRAVGRMALTNYLTHTVVCVLIFEGWAFGNWNQLRYTEQFEIVGWILGAQIVLCPLWLALFRFGPMEWLWRSLTYWRQQPMRRRRGGDRPPFDAPPPSAGVPGEFGVDIESPIDATAG